MVFISTLNNISVISCRLVLLVEETGDSAEIHRPAASKQYFSYIVQVSFIGGGNWRFRRNTQTCRKLLKIFITYK